jgi:hypothetical protein
MRQVSLLRLYLLRAMYGLIAIGMGVQIWPLMFHHRPWEPMHGVAVCLLAALTLMCAIGVRHPVKMLPVLLFELAWKSIWFLAVALPSWSAGALDAATMENIFACGLGVVLVPLVVPWDYVWFTYVRAQGDRWGRAPASASVHAPAA